MRLIETFRSRWFPTVVAVGVIAALAIGGGIFLYGAQGDLRAGIPHVEVNKLRQGFFTLGQVYRLQHAVTAAVTAEEVSEQEREEISRALDYLFVREGHFRRLHEGSGQPPEEVTRILDLLRQVVQSGDEAVSGGQRQIRQFAVRLDPLVEQMRKQLLHYVDVQIQAQRNAVEAQTQTLSRMTLTVGALLGVLALVATALVLLLRAEAELHRQRRVAEEKAKFLASRDPLTGLLNRRSFHEQIGRMLKAGGTPAVFLADIDNFKETNDREGHAAGDLVLRTVARRLDGAVAEKGGFTARLGGDEIASVLPGPVATPEAAEICSHLMRDIRQPVSEDLNHAPRVSFGICLAQELAERETVSGSTLLKGADVALYEAKAAGRETCVIYDSDLAARVAERRAIECALPAAVERGDFFLVYQSQVALPSGTVYGLEALARWRWRGQTLSPASFMPFAEASGLVRELDVWGLREATRTVAELNAERGTAVSVAVNLTSIHFRDFSIVEHVRDALLASGLPPALLSLEITETIVVEHWEAAKAVIARLRQIGVRIALDDFGAGYSSLRYVQELSIDTVKLDQSLLDGLDASNQRQRLVRAAVEMAKAIGSRVVAEGVETNAQLELVTTFGCDGAQGFLFDRPMPASDLAVKLRSTNATPEPEVGDGSATGLG